MRIEMGVGGADVRSGIGGGGGGVGGRYDAATVE